MEIKEIAVILLCLGICLIFDYCLTGIISQSEGRREKDES